MILSNMPTHRLKSWHITILSANWKLAKPSETFQSSSAIYISLTAAVPLSIGICLSHWKDSVTWGQLTSSNRTRKSLKIWSKFWVRFQSSEIGIGKGLSHRLRWPPRTYHTRRQMWLLGKLYVQYGLSEPARPPWELETLRLGYGMCLKRSTNSTSSSFLGGLLQLDKLKKSSYLQRRYERGRTGRPWIWRLTGPFWTAARLSNTWRSLSFKAMSCSGSTAAANSSTS